MQRIDRIPGLEAVRWTIFAAGAMLVSTCLWILLVSWGSFGFAEIMALAAAISLVAVIIGFVSSPRDAICLWLGGVLILTSDALLASHYATVLGFTQLAIASQIGTFAALFSIVSVFAVLYRIALGSGSRWIAAGTLVASVAFVFPVKLSSTFFI